MGKIIVPVWSLEIGNSGKMRLINESSRHLPNWFLIGGVYRVGEDRVLSIPMREKERLDWIAEPEDGWLDHLED